MSLNQALNGLKWTRRPKTLIDPMQSKILTQLPMLQRRPSATKKQLGIPSYFSSERRPSEPSFKKSVEKQAAVAKSQWDDIIDPEERKKAILAKHGFKPFEKKKSKHDDPLKGVDTIPDHIMKDEVLYRKYIQENVQIEEEESSRESTPERFKKDPKEGSFSSLMNILSAIKKGTMQKNALDARDMLDRKAQEASTLRTSSSVQDLSNVPGSCQNLRQYFENCEDSDDEDETPVRRSGPVMRSSSCATIGSMWSNQINNRSTETTSHDMSSIKSGIVSNLKHHLANDNDPEVTLNNPQFRKSLSHLELEENQNSSYVSDAKMELEALRSSGKTSSIFRLERGDRASMRKAQSNLETARSQDHLDLDDEAMEEMRQNKQNIKAMFEASAPKYRYGGSNECLLKEEEPSKRGKHFYNHF